MKKLTSLPCKLLLLSAVTALSLTPAQATSKYWTDTGTGTYSSGGTGGNWSTSSTGAGNTTSAAGTGDTALFTANNGSSPASNITVQFTGSTAVGSMEFLGLHTGTSLLESSSSSGRTLTLGTANTSSTILQVDSGAGAVTIGDSNNDIEIVTASTNTSVTDTITNNSTLNIVNNFTVNGTSTHSYNQTTTTVLVGGSGTTTFGGALSDDDSHNFMALTVGTGSGSGTTVNLNAANTFSGATLINGGTINANIANALGGTSGVTIENGGSLVFGANINNAMASGTNVTTSAGTGSITINGGSETIGTLTLSSGTVTTINFGANGGALTINDIAFNGGTLVINGWTGTSSSGGNGTEIILNHSNNRSYSDWTSHENKISWTNVTFNGNSGSITDNASTYNHFGVYQGIPNGTPITPAPEPSTVFIGLGLLALLVWGGRRQLLETGRRLVPARA